MARSRNIKPGFFLNDVLAEIEPLGRLLFAGLWTIADREGRLEDRPKKIKAAILPYDECDVDKLLDELNSKGFILRYEAKGERYIQIINFLKHQNPHKREAESIIPAPEGIGTIQDTIQAQDKHQANIVHSSEQHRTGRADSLNLIPDSLNLIPEEEGATTDATTDERTILKTLKSVQNYPFEFKKDLDLIRALAVDFPDVDIGFETKKWATYKLDKPLTKQSNPRSQLRNWMVKVIEFKKGGMIRGQPKKIPGNTGGYSAKDHQQRLDGTGTDWSKEPDYL